MAEVKWIKIVTDIFDDEKVLLIESLPDSDGLIVIWFKLLCLAGKQNNSGVFLMNNRIPYTEEMLAAIFRRPLSTVKLALKTFEDFGMIEVVDGVIVIPNWDKHQSLDQLELAREQTRKRVAKHRERQKQIALGEGKEENVTQCNVTCNGDVTQSNADRIDKIRIDKNRIDNNILSDEFEEIWSIYPKKQGKTNALKSYIRARKNGTDKETVLNGLSSYIDYIKASKTPTQYIKQGSTWFNQECWNDDYTIETKGGNSNDRVKYGNGSIYANLEC